MKKHLPFWATMIGSGLGSGFWPWGPGTMGALLATVVWLALSLVLDAGALWVVTLALAVVFTVLGTWATSRLEPYWGEDPSRVVVDDYMGAFTAVSHLADTGCRRIAFYGSPMTMEISKNRFNGYKDALFKHGLPYDESLIYHCDNRTDAEAITPEVLSADNHPDAFFAINDDTAIGILYTAKRMGFRVPEDICVCGFTNGERSRACEPMLTTVEQRGVRVGEEAANILIGKVEGLIPKDKVERRVVRTKLIIRGTTRG